MKVYSFIKGYLNRVQFKGVYKGYYMGSIVGFYSIGALIALGAPLYYKYSKEPHQYSIGNYIGPYIVWFMVRVLGSSALYAISAKSGGVVL